MKKRRFHMENGVCVVAGARNIEFLKQVVHILFVYNRTI